MLYLVFMAMTLKLNRVHALTLTSHSVKLVASTAKINLRLYVQLCWMEKIPGTQTFTWVEPSTFRTLSCELSHLKVTTTRGFEPIVVRGDDYFEAMRLTTLSQRPLRMIRQKAWVQSCQLNTNYRRTDGLIYYIPMESCCKGIKKYLSIAFQVLLWFVNNV